MRRWPSAPAALQRKLSLLPALALLGGAGLPARAHADCIDLSSSTSSPPLASIIGLGGADSFGWRVAIGDLNGDGLPDLVVTAGGGHAHDRPNAGAVFIRFGGSAGLGFPDAGTTVDLRAGGGIDVRIDGAIAGDVFGGQVAIGDVTGDGKNDLIVSQYNDAAGASKVFVIPGPFSPGTLDMAVPPSGTRVFTGPYRLGEQITVGDLTGDGVQDLVMAAPSASAAGANAGLVFVVSGGAGFPDAGTVDLSTPGRYTTRFAGAEGDNAGSALAVGDVAGDGGFADLLIGAPGASPPGLAGAGVVYLVLGGASFPTGDRSLDNSTCHARFIGADTGGGLGRAVLAGDLDGAGLAELVLAAPFTSPNGRSTSGSVYVVLGSTTLPLGDHDLAAFTEYQVRFDGDVANARLAGECCNTGAGLLAIGNFDATGPADLFISDLSRSFAYMIRGSGPLSSGIRDLQVSTSWDARFDGPNYAFASQIAAGDIGGDGTVDLVLANFTTAANSFEPEARRYAGEAYVVFGSANPPTGIVDVTTGGTGVRFLGGSSGDELGYALATGDFDFDGNEDLAVGAPGADLLGHPASGGVYLFHGGQGFPLGRLDLGADGGYPVRLAGGAASEMAGKSLLAADVNGDGIMDLVVGAPGANPEGRPGAGKVYVMFGKVGAQTSGTVDLASEADVTVLGSQAGSALGEALAAGDFIPDAGAVQWALGAPFDSVAFPSSGSVYVLRGPLTAGTLDLSDSNSYATRLNGHAASSEAGTALAAADLDGNGTTDLIVGAPGVATGGESGAVYVIEGGPTFPPGSADIHDAAHTRFTPDVGFGGKLGRTVATGRLNSDTQPDLVYSAPTNKALGRPYSGAVYVLFGGSAFPTGDVLVNGSSGWDTRFLGAATDDQLGLGLATGDANGDGHDELMLGSPTASPSVNGYEGMAYVRTGGAPFVLGTVDLNTAAACDGGSSLTPGTGSRFFGLAFAIANLTGNSARELVVGHPGFAVVDWLDRANTGEVLVFDGTKMAGPADGGPSDGGASDAAVPDGGLDGGASDAAVPDSGLDGGATDAAVPDGGTDAGADAAVPDGGTSDGGPNGVGARSLSYLARPCGCSQSGLGALVWLSVVFLARRSTGNGRRPKRCRRPTDPAK